MSPGRFRGQSSGTRWARGADFDRSFGRNPIREAFAGGNVQVQIGSFSELKAVQRGHLEKKKTNFPSVLSWLFVVLVLC